MKNLLFLSAILFSFSSIAQTSAEDRPVRTCEVRPLLEDCAGEEGHAGVLCTQEAILAHVLGVVVYPKAAIDAGISGKVYVAFVVEIDGAVGTVRIMRGLGESDGAQALSNAAIDAVKSLPNFSPGLEDGIPVRVEFVVPVSFVLD
jgi:TonB family protein